MSQRFTDQVLGFIKPMFHKVLGKIPNKVIDDGYAVPHHRRTDLNHR